jgi:signal transduction histidine kinase
LDNLISNAIRYSPDGGEIVISSEAVKGGVAVGIRDNGIGIPEELQDKVFDRFFRVTGSRRQTFPGTGLGLYISAGIIHRHGGAISVESRLNEGSVFHFTLPYESIIENQLQ